MGSGTLLCAIVERLMDEEEPVEVQIEGFEVDSELFAAATSILNEATERAAHKGIRIQLNFFHTDFVLNALRFQRPSLLDTAVGRHHYQHIIANPPYFKISTMDIRRQMSRDILNGHTNIYTLFMELAARMLQDGRACFVVPRSFCSGTYFARFRQEFLELAQPEHIHLFETRDDAFSQDNVLQENMVLTFVPIDSQHDDFSLTISSSGSVADLANKPQVRTIDRRQFLSSAGVFRLPVSDVDETILNAVDHWTDSLHSFGMEISTGPVVAFRAEPFLVSSANSANAVPLLWMHHIKPQQVNWPLHNGFHKPQHILSNSDTQTLLVRNVNYVLLRRFSAKEEQRRLVAAPYRAEDFRFTRLGLENHLNYIYRRRGEMTEVEAVGLAALFNSGLIDRYFRISNGNTQVNATELRALPLPPLHVTTTIGETLMTAPTDTDLNAVVVHILQVFGLLPKDFPILRETRQV